MSVEVTFISAAGCYEAVAGRKQFIGVALESHFLFYEDTAPPVATANPDMRRIRPVIAGGSLITLRPVKKRTTLTRIGGN